MDKKFPEVFTTITKDCTPSINIGGPAVVGLIHIAQILEKEDVEVYLYGASGSTTPVLLIHDELKKRILPRNGLLEKDDER